MDETLGTLNMHMVMLCVIAPAYIHSHIDRSSELRAHVIINS